MKDCACPSKDAHNCWALRYHGHTGVSELTVNNEGGPCECSCHETDLEEEESVTLEHGSPWINCPECDLLRPQDHEIGKCACNYKPTHHL